MYEVYQIDAESERQNLVELLISQAESIGLLLMTAEQLRRRTIVEAVRRDFSEVNR